MTGLPPTTLSRACANVNKHAWLGRAPNGHLVAWLDFRIYGTPPLRDVQPAEGRDDLGRGVVGLRELPE